MLAVDLVIEPPANIRQLACAFNTKLHYASKSGFAFDEFHVPHITIAQLYIKEENLVKVIDAVTNVLHNIKPINLNSSNLDPGPQFGPGNYVPSFAITEPLEAVNNLHNNIMHALDPFIEKIDGKAEYFFQIPNQSIPISKSSITYVANFKDKSAFEKYWPHITIGVGPLNVIEEISKEFKPFNFVGDVISLYQLGNYCTCAKLLKQWNL
jgi:hypothetical protein